MYFQRFSSAPPAAYPTNAAENPPAYLPPVPAPRSPYVQRLQFAEPRPEFAQALFAPDAAYPAEGAVQTDGSPYPLPLQPVDCAVAQLPSEPGPAGADVDRGQAMGSSWVPPGGPVAEPYAASPAEAPGNLQAEPWAAEAVAPDIDPARPARNRRLRRNAANRTPADWVFCLSMTLMFLLSVLVALIYFSYKKLRAIQRRGPHHIHTTLTTSDF